MEVYAAQMVAEMRMLAPVLQQPDRRRTPGALRDSIGWTWGDAPRGATTVMRLKGRVPDGLYLTIYAGSAEAFYARWQEFGTQKMPANPFFFPVIRSNRRRVASGISRAVKKAVKAT